MKNWMLDAGDFAQRQALSCLFPGFIFLMLALTWRMPLRLLPRYDLLLGLCLAMQWVLWRCRLETMDEVKVIFLFHGIGLALELYKTHLGAWQYPGYCWFKIGGVPLYSGFLYASVASYLCQAWRRFDLTLEGWPPLRRTLPLVLAVYGNFFTERVLPDARWLLLAWVVWMLRRTHVWFTVRGRRRRMPLLVSFGLIGGFVWIAENIATYYGAWRYPNQHGLWHMVQPAKIVSWDLLVIISFVIVAQLKHVKENGLVTVNAPVPAVNAGTGV
jgi:uncharacterized membrane protein YoaT (DUF817 family)